MNEASAAPNKLGASTGEFVELVAAGTPAPGGGSVAAYCGQLAAGLGRMVCNLTAGKAKFGAVEPRIIEIRSHLELLSSKLNALIDEDAESFQHVMSAYKLPKTSEQEAAERTLRINSALKGAISVPLETMRASLEVIRLLEELARIGNPNALSDVASAAQVGKAAINAAYYNVAVNVQSISSTDETDSLTLTAREMIGEAETIAGRVQDAFLGRLG